MVLSSTPKQMVHVGRSGVIYNRHWGTLLKVEAAENVELVLMTQLFLLPVLTAAFR